MISCPVARWRRNQLRNRTGFRVRMWFRNSRVIYIPLFVLIRIRLCENPGPAGFRTNGTSGNSTASYNPTENFRPQNRTAYSSSNTISPVSSLQRWAILRFNPRINFDFGTSRDIMRELVADFSFPLFVYWFEYSGWIPSAFSNFQMGNGRDTGKGSIVNRKSLLIQE